MRKWIAAICVLSVGVVTPVYAASTSAGSTSGTSNSTTALAGPGGFSNAQSFGLANTSIVVAPNTVATQSSEINSVSGIALGNASFSGGSNAHAASIGFSTTWAVH